MLRGAGGAGEEGFDDTKAVAIVLGFSESEDVANRQPPLSTFSLWLLSDIVYLLISFNSQLPHKTVDLIFYSVIVNNKLTILWGRWLSKSD